MIKIGLTGNIAAGKSEIEKILKAENIPVIDADAVCNELLTNDENVINQIKTTFLQYDILDVNNNIAKKKLADLIFSNEVAKRQLEGILHPLVKQIINRFFEEHKKSNMAVASVALIFEANMQNMFDKIIVVTADENTRLSRLMARNNLPLDKAQRMLKSQLPDSEKLRQADYVIHNNFDLDNLYTQSKSLLAGLACDI